MVYPLEGATLQEVHHDPPIQKTSTLALRMQVPFGVLSEIQVSNPARQSSRLCEAPNQLVVSIPPKYAMSSFVEYLKGKLIEAIQGELFD
jgi:hypothetical protein